MPDSTHDGVSTFLVCCLAHKGVRWSSNPFKPSARAEKHALTCEDAGEGISNRSLHEAFTKSSEPIGGAGRRPQRQETGTSCATFAVMTTEPRTERVPVMMEPSLVRDLEDAAKHLGISRSELIRRTLAADASITENARRRRDGFTPVSRPGDPDGAQGSDGVDFARKWVKDYDKDHERELMAERLRQRADGLIRF